MCPFDQRGAPREACAHARQQHQLARFEPPVVGRVGQRERNRAGRGVPVPFDVDHGLLLGNPELAHSVIDDPDIGLVRDVDVDVVDRLPALGEDRLRRADHHASRELEDLAAVHLHELLRILELPRAAAGQPEVRAAGAVRAELEAEEAALVDRLHHDGAGAVAEQHDASSGRSSRGSSRARRRRPRAPASRARRRASPCACAIA